MIDSLGISLPDILWWIPRADTKYMEWVMISQRWLMARLLQTVRRCTRKCWAKSYGIINYELLTYDWRTTSLSHWALVQKMAWRRPGDKPLSEPLMVSICVTRPQWVIDTFIQDVFTDWDQSCIWQEEYHSEFHTQILCELVDQS